MSDIGSLQSSNSPPSRWWLFTSPRPREQLASEYNDSAKTEKKPTHSFKERSISWLPASAAALREGTWKAEKPAESSEQGRRRDWGLQIALPTPSAAPFTLAQNATPGWETPWTSRPAAQGPSRDDAYDFGEVEPASSSSTSTDDTVWRSRKKRLRSFILSNTYVPLVCLLSLRGPDGILTIPTVVPIRQHNLHRRRTRRIDPSATAGEGKWHHGRSRQLPVSCCCFLLTLDAHRSLQYSRYHLFSFNPFARSICYICKNCLPQLYHGV